MMPLPAAPAAHFWRRQARRTAWRHNLACVLGGFLPLCLALSAVFACALLAARGKGSVAAKPWMAAYGLGLIAGVATAGWRARGRFFTPGDALVRLEWHLGLHNRLSAAAAGVGDFPVPQAAPDGYQFHWRKILPPLAGAALLVSAAALVPVSRRAATYIPAVAPVAWTQTAEWIDTLKKADAVEEPALEDLRERLEQLRQQPAQDWYSQSSLEAGDHLREQTAQSLQTLQRDLQTALDSMEAAQKLDDQSIPEMKTAQANLANVLKGLEMGNLPLNHDLLNHLKEADLSKLKNLDPRQLEEMKQRLQAGTQACQQCLRPGDMKGKGEPVTITQGKVPKDARFPRDNETSAPLAFNQKPTELGTKDMTEVSNDSLEHAMPGDLMRVGKGEHHVDPAKYAGPVASGAAASNGEGGEAVWRNDLTPKEREVLRNFFK